MYLERKCIVCSYISIFMQDESQLYLSVFLFKHKNTGKLECKRFLSVPELCTLLLVK